MQSFSLERHLFLALLFSTFSLLSCGTTGAQLAMGFRVGEVQQDSAIVWTRITRDGQRNWEGYREPTKRQPKVDEYVPSKIRVAERQGEVVGAPGQIRVSYLPSGGARETQTEWVTVTAASDFVHQFRLTGLEAGSSYSLRVEARNGPDAAVSTTAEGSFTTPALRDEWREPMSRASVVSGGCADATARESSRLKTSSAFLIIDLPCRG